MTEMQRKFEEWALRQKWCINKAGDTYNNTYVGCSWQAWQAAIASRAAIVVKLPNLFDGSPDNATYYDYMYRKSEMEKALDDAGVDYE